MGELMGVATGWGVRLMVVFGSTGVQPLVALMLSRLLFELCVDEFACWPMNVLVSADGFAVVLLFFDPPSR